MMSLAIALFSTLWGMSLSCVWRHLDDRRPATLIIAGELNLIAVVIGGAFVETILILGAVYL